MPGAKYDIFISYSRADTTMVAPLRDELRRVGYRVFFDTQSIAAGKNWKPTLKNAIQHSRVMLLCWSAAASQSEVTAFEYTAAEALNITIIPWLLDTTPLPTMLKEKQGSRLLDPTDFVAYIRPTVGRPLTHHRRLLTVASALLVTASAFALWRGLHPPPPPPWVFQGEVTVSDKGRMPIYGVEVNLQTDAGLERTATTDGRGHYEFQLSQPQPKFVHVRFRKAGFEAEDPINVPTGKPCNMAMLPLP